MRILAVDDEQLMLERLCNCIKEAAPNAELISYSLPSQALSYIHGNEVDVAFLDIKMRGMDGIELGKQIKFMSPKTNIIFCTGYSDYIFDAVSKVRCSGYLLKPVCTEDVVEELANLRIPVEERNIGAKGLYVQCFGNFEVFYDGKPLPFAGTKTKELFAYLIDRRGAMVQNGEIMVNLWEDDNDHSAYLKKCRKDLKDTLKSKGLEQLIVQSWGGIAIDRDHICCDYFDWWNDKADGIRAFNGSYMEQYSWAEVTKAALLEME